MRTAQWRFFRFTILSLQLGIAGLGCDLATERSRSVAPRWTSAELQLLRSLSLLSLPDLPASASNRVALSEGAAELGRGLFFDTALSRNGQISCSSCHVSALNFTDGRATSKGLAEGRRNAPSIVGGGYRAWLYWDGRRDSLWSQALAPIESNDEMGTTRGAVVRYVTTSVRYATAYRELFGPPPSLTDHARFPEHFGPFGEPAEREAWSRLTSKEREEVNEAFANVGKAIEAFERRLVPGESRFDRYVDALLSDDVEEADRSLSRDEEAGLRLFIDDTKGRCVRCHNGPLLTNDSFHDVGTGRLGGIPDLGRYVGLEALRLDPFNCLGAFSDAAPVDCRALRFTNNRDASRDVGAFHTPSLRNVAETAPYHHNGAFPRLSDVLDHYRSPPIEPPNELSPIEWTDREQEQLEAFLRTLSGGFVERDN